jgi:hypothetical protein
MDDKAFTDLMGDIQQDITNLRGGEVLPVLKKTLLLDKVNALAIEFGRRFVQTDPVPEPKPDETLQDKDAGGKQD